MAGTWPTSEVGDDGPRRISGAPHVRLEHDRGSLRRNYEVWIRHNSTPAGVARKKPRTRALKVIPASDPDFAKLFGIREDTESMHNHMKTTMVNKRLRHLGRHRVLFNLHAYQLRTNMMALLAHFDGNEEELERWFGRSSPPDECRLAA